MESARLKLYGYPVSNYFNVVRAILIEKGLDFEIAFIRASQNQTFLEMNPMGKVPIIETPHGWIAETVAILEYLDDAFPTISLRPDDIGMRARARQIVNILQIYVEAPARSLFAGVFGGGENSPAAIAAARATLDRAIQALNRLMIPSPFLCGRDVSSADLFAFYNLDLVDRLTRFVWGRSIIGEVNVADWHAMLAKRTSSHVVMADFERYFVQYLEDHGAVYRADTSGQFNYA